MPETRTTSQIPAFRLTVQRRMADYRERLAERIVRTRASQGLSREELALRAHVSVKQLKRIEDRKSDPRLSTVRKLADAMDVAVTDLRPDLEAEERQLDRIEESLAENSRKLTDLGESIARLIAVVSEEPGEPPSEDRASA